eukprot:2428122-Rhodomonas_salina.1
MAIMSPDVSVSGSLEFEGSLGSHGETKNKKEQSPTDDITLMMCEVSVSNLSELYDADDDKPMDVSTLTILYTERTYYGSNGAPGEYEVFFGITKRFLWNDEDVEEKEQVKALHQVFVMDFKKCNA